MLKGPNLRGIVADDGIDGRIHGLSPGPQSVISCKFEMILGGSGGRLRRHHFDRRRPVLSFVIGR